MARWISILLAPLMLGVLAAAADKAAGGLHQDEVSRSFGLVLNAGCVWAAVAVLAGRLTRSLAGSLVAGALALVVAVICYYAYGVTFGDRTTVGVGGVRGSLELWLVGAIVAGPVLGWIGWRTQRSGWLGMFCRCVVPAGTIAELGVLRYGEHSFKLEPLVASVQLTVVLVAIAALGAALIGSVRRPTR